MIMLYNWANALKTKGNQITKRGNDYNRFQLLWKETEIIFGVNDQTTFTYTKKSSFTLNEWPFDQQGFLIINIAVGGNLGGPVNTQDISSMKMYVDYVRIYQ